MESRDMQFPNVWWAAAFFVSALLWWGFMAAMYGAIKMAFAVCSLLQELL